MNSRVRRRALDGQDEEKSTEVEEVTMVSSFVLSLETIAGWSVAVTGGLGGGSDGMRFVTNSPAHWIKCSMVLGSFCIFLANGRPILNKVLMLFLCFKQNQTVSVISVSIKAPEMTCPPRTIQGGKVKG